MSSVALFVPCYIDQLYPQVAIAALRVLERLGVPVVVPQGAVCCGQPPANAGYEQYGARAMQVFVDTFRAYEHIVVLSGSCALHLRMHAGHAGMDGAALVPRVTEFCAYLHDVVGVERVRALGAALPSRVALHIGCHGLRGLGLATPSELQVPVVNKVRALLETVAGLSFADLRRPDECCGFGGTFAMTEPAISTRMGEDRLRDFAAGAADLVVSPDMSCLMHLDGVARQQGRRLRMVHVAEVLDARAGLA